MKISFIQVMLNGHVLIVYFLVVHAILFLIDLVMGCAL